MSVFEHKVKKNHLVSFLSISHFNAFYFFAVQSKDAANSTVQESQKRRMWIDLLSSGGGFNLNNIK